MALGIDAPDESFTAPKIVPVGNWAASGNAARMSTVSQTAFRFKN
jgi:hypothetical protein